MVKRMTTTNLAATAITLGAAAGGVQRDRQSSRSDKALNGGSSTQAAVRVRFWAKTRTGSH